MDIVLVAGMIFHLFFRSGDRCGSVVGHECVDKWLQDSSSNV